MLFKLIKKTNEVKSKNGSKSFTNFYLVSEDTGIRLPIEIKCFKKDGKINNKSDFAVALKVALYEKEN